MRVCAAKATHQDSKMRLGTEEKKWIAGLSITYPVKVRRFFNSSSNNNNFGLCLRGRLRRNFGEGAAA